MPRLSWTLNLVNGPAVGSADGDIEQCLTDMETALREAFPTWTPEHQSAFARVAAAIRHGERHITAPAFLVSVED